MRLTVHVEGAEKRTTEKTTKDGLVRIKKTYNTLSYSGVHPDEVGTILSEIKAGGRTPTKHYLSNEKIKGFSRGKRNKK